MVGIGLDFIVLALLLPFGHSFFFVVALSLDMVFFLFVCFFLMDSSILLSMAVQLLAVILCPCRR